MEKKLTWLEYAGVVCCDACEMEQPSACWKRAALESDALKEGGGSRGKRVL